MSNAGPPLPGFTRATAIQKVRIGEHGWNRRDPSRVGLAYPSSNQATPDRPAIVEFLTTG
jgi:nuclear transport factor 2 (NTF2) superfamily protein